MTNGDYPGAEPESARAAARERARELRELHKKQDRRRRLLLQGGIASGLLIILAIVAIVIFVFPPAEVRAPQNMLSDGIKIGEDLKVIQTEAQNPGQAPVPSAPNPPEVVDIQMYVDYLCTNCGIFQQENEDQLRSWVESGAATLEIHPVAILTTKSAGSQYSLRAASVAACVADLSPDHFYDFHVALLTNQPEEGTPGLTDEEILDRAEAAGVSALGQIRRCVSESRYRSWVKEATVRAIEGPIPNADVTTLEGPLMILVNGHTFPFTSDTDAADLAQFVVQAAGDAFSSDPTPTPTPTGSPTPTPAP
ncbi:MAG: thioredoxin domain-containing protein [Pseudolysinimonas sp.]